MNRLQALSADREFCVTLNRSEAIDPAKVLRTIQYAHPVLHPRGRRGAKAPSRDERPTAAPTSWMDHCHNLKHAQQGLVTHLMYEGVTTPYRVGGRAGNEPE